MENLLAQLFTVQASAVSRWTHTSISALFPHSSALKKDNEALQCTHKQAHSHTHTHSKSERNRRKPYHILTLPGNVVKGRNQRASFLPTFFFLLRSFKTLHNSPSPGGFMRTPYHILPVVCLRDGGKRARACARVCVCGIINIRSSLSCRDSGSLPEGKNIPTTERGSEPGTEVAHIATHNTHTHKKAVLENFNPTTLIREMGPGKPFALIVNCPRGILQSARLCTKQRQNGEPM